MENMFKNPNDLRANILPQEAHADDVLKMSSSQR